MNDLVAFISGLSEDEVDTLHTALAMVMPNDGLHAELSRALARCGDADAQRLGDRLASIVLDEDQSRLLGQLWSLSDVNLWYEPS